MAAERIWLDVPFSEKDEAKALGARWDPAARRWHAPRPGMTGLERRAPVPDVPQLLPGEDRTLGSGLFVDLVPSSCWFTNARSCLTQRDWERLRRMVLARAGQHCEVCGAAEDRPTQRWLEVHERWAFDDATRIQSLRRLICLCSDCHTTTHFGLAGIRGLAVPAQLHLMTVTGLTEAEADRHITDAFAVWEHRSRFPWALDLSLLTQAGITPSAPPTADNRQTTARTQLDNPRPDTPPQGAGTTCGFPRSAPPGRGTPLRPPEPIHGGTGGDVNHVR